jgi:hypothetical protein
MREMYYNGSMQTAGDFQQVGIVMRLQSLSCDWQVYHEN